MPEYPGTGQRKLPVPSLPIMPLFSRVPRWMTSGTEACTSCTSTTRVLTTSPATVVISLVTSSLPFCPACTVSALPKSSPASSMVWVSNGSSRVTVSYRTALTCKRSSARSAAVRSRYGVMAAAG